MLLTSAVLIGLLLSRPGVTMISIGIGQPQQQQSQNLGMSAPGLQPWPRYASANSPQSQYSGSGTYGNSFRKTGLQGLKQGFQVPPGYANIRGELINVSNKVIQRILPGSGTNYYTYDNQNGAPIFKRREIDAERHFVVFPDPAYPPGDGYYIVLRKLLGVNIPGVVRQPLYEAFHLSLRDSIHGFVTQFSNQQYEDKQSKVGTFLQRRG